MHTFRLASVVLFGLLPLLGCKSDPDMAKCSDRDLPEGVRWDGCSRVCDTLKGDFADACDKMTTVEWGACTKDKNPRACAHNCHMNGHPSEGCDKLDALCTAGDKEACQLVKREAVN